MINSRDAHLDDQLDRWQLPSDGNYVDMAVSLGEERGARITLSALKHFKLEGDGSYSDGFAKAVEIVESEYGRLRARST